MFSFKRALMAAAAIMTLLIIFRHSHQSDIPNPKVYNSPSPTGLYDYSRFLLERLPEGVHPEPPAATQKPQPTLPKWDGDNGGREPLVQKTKQKQVPLQDLGSKPLRQQLAYTFPYDIQAKFPAFIWQTWKHTPSSGSFEEIFRPAEASWTELHPNFVHEVITDSVAVHLIRHFYATIPAVQEAYAALPTNILKADFFRYLVLLARGGIYSDIDTLVLKSAVEWVPLQVPRSTYGLVIGIEADPDRPDWAEWYARRIQFCQWTIQSKPGHPVLVDIVASITEETLRRKRAGQLSAKQISSVMEYTGPAIWTDTIFRFFNNPDYFDMSASTKNITWHDFTGITTAKKVGDVIVLPITSFSPGVGQMGAGDVDDPMAFVQHLFEGTWKPESERHIGEAKTT